MHHSTRACHEGSSAMRLLEGKSAIITGAGRGIGKAVAHKFLQEGARLLICDIVADRIADAARDLSPYGEVHAQPGDVTEATFCTALVERARAAAGPYDRRGHRRDAVSEPRAGGQGIIGSIA